MPHTVDETDSDLPTTMLAMVNTRLIWESNASQSQTKANSNIPRANCVRKGWTRINDRFQSSSNHKHKKFLPTASSAACFVNYQYYENKQNSKDRGHWTKDKTSGERLCLPLAENGKRKLFQTQLHFNCTWMNKTLSLRQDGWSIHKNKLLYLQYGSLVDERFLILYNGSLRCLNLNCWHIPHVTFPWDW